jgi:hypothetical protein
MSVLSKMGKQSALKVPGNSLAITGKTDRTSQTFAMKKAAQGGFVVFAKALRLR